MADLPDYLPGSRTGARELRRTNGGQLLFAAVGVGLFGVAAAIGLARVFRWGASSDQLPGLARSIGIDPRNDVLRLVLLVLVPTLAGFALGRIRREWRRRAGRATWRGFLGAGCFLLGLGATVGAGLRVGVVVGTLAGGIARLVQRRWFDVLASNRVGLAAVLAHTLLGWAFLAGPAALRGVTPLFAAFGLFCASLALALWLGRGDLERGAIPLAWSGLLIPLALWTGRPDRLSWAGGIATWVLPLFSRSFNDRFPDSRFFSRWLLTRVLLPGSFLAFTVVVFLRSPPIADLFEDGHGLLPASEYLRGEKPYRDIVPGHGFLTDGGLQLASLRLFGDDYAGATRGARIAGALFWPCVYFLGLGATGSASVALWALFLTFFWFPQYTFLRAILSLAVLSLAAAAARTSRRGLWIATGAALPIAFLGSVDFGWYAASGCLVAIAVCRRNRRMALLRFGSGLLFSAAVAAAFLSLAGSLRAFVSSTFLDLGELMQAYTIGYRVDRFAISSWVSRLAFLFDRESFFGCALAGSAVFAAVLAARFPSMGQRTRGLAPVLAWFFAATLSVIERRHFAYPGFVLAMLVVLVSRSLIGWSGWATLRGFFAAALIAATLFCNLPGLYYLFDRDCPIRYYEVAFYETDRAQDEVIRALERNLRVRAVLWRTGLVTDSIDKIPNSTRAPLVAAYIRREFHPSFSRGGVEFWERNSVRVTGNGRGRRPIGAVGIRPLGCAGLVDGDRPEVARRWDGTPRLDAAASARQEWCD